MKKLFVAALVLNLVIWLWARREAPEVIDGLLSPDVGVVRLVDQAAVPHAAGGSPSTTGSPVAPEGASAAEQARLGASAEWIPPQVAVADADLDARAPAPVPGADDDAHVLATSPPERLAASALPPVMPTPSLLPLGASPEASEAVAVPPGSGLLAADAPPTAPDRVPTERAALPVVPEPTAAPSDEPEPPSAGANAGAETRAAPTEILLPAPPAQAREVCETVGPFPQQGLADAFLASLPHGVVSDGIREERVPRPPRHWVLAPVQPNREATAAYLVTLQAAGIKDAWRAQSGVYAGRLVVGVFSTDENARRHAAVLAGKGVATEVRKQQSEETRWWVDIRHGGGDATRVDAPDGAEVSLRDCGRVAGP